MNKNIVSTHLQQVIVNNKTEDVTVYRVRNDKNGNPRYVVHFTDLGVQLHDYGTIPNLTKYRAGWFGGGYVLQSYNIQTSLQWAANTVKDFYKVDEPAMDKFQVYEKRQQLHKYIKADSEQRTRILSAEPLTIVVNNDLTATAFLRKDDTLYTIEYTSPQFHSLYGHVMAVAQTTTITEAK